MLRISDAGNSMAEANMGLWQQILLKDQVAELSPYYRFMKERRENLRGFQHYASG